jgi:hypothetical protein
MSIRNGAVRRVAVVISYDQPQFSGMLAVIKGEEQPFDLPLAGLSVNGALAPLGDLASGGKGRGDAGVGASGGVGGAAASHVRVSRAFINPRYMVTDGY